MRKKLPANAFRHHYKVFFTQGGSREVLASSPEEAVLAAKIAERWIGTRGQLTHMGVFDLGHRGTDTKGCPLCAAAMAAAESEGGDDHAA